MLTLMNFIKPLLCQFSIVSCSSSMMSVVLHGNTFHLTASRIAINKPNPQKNFIIPAIRVHVTTGTRICSIEQYTQDD